MRSTLERYRRYELRTYDPLWYCPTCFGFWAVGDSLSRGVADPHDAHPALTASLPPRACRACAEPLKPDGSCPKCGASAILSLVCPSCDAVMEAENRGTITTDRCSACRGTWFDTGEIAVLFGLKPPQGLAASMVDEDAPDAALPALVDIAFILLRAFLLRAFLLRF